MHQHVAVLRKQDNIIDVDSLGILLNTTVTGHPPQSRTGQQHSV